MRIFQTTALLLVFILIGVMAPARSPAVDQPGNGGESRGLVLKIFAVKHRLAGELLPAVRTGLSPAGKASVDRVGNTLVVADDAAHLKKLAALIGRLDHRVPQVVIHLRASRQQHHRHALSTQTGIDTPHGRLSLNVGTFRQNRHFMLRLSSGSKGYLRFSRLVPVTSHWLDFCHRFGFRYSWLTSYHTLETGLAVQPTVTGASVHLRLIPMLTFDADHDLTFVDGATTLTLQPSIWTPVASGNRRVNNMYIALVTGDASRQQTNIQVEIKADIQ